MIAGSTTVGWLPRKPTKAAFQGIEDRDAWCPVTNHQNEHDSIHIPTASQETRKFFLFCLKKKIRDQTNHTQNFYFVLGERVVNTSKFHHAKKIRNNSYFLTYDARKLYAGIRVNVLFLANIINTKHIFSAYQLLELES